MSGISEETKEKIKLWTPDKTPIDPPDWWVWTGGWYQLDGDKNYYTNWDDLDEDSVVLDIGSYECAWTKRMAEKYACQIHAVEPAPRAHDMAKKVIGAAHSVHLHNFALWDKDTTLTLYDCNRDGANTIAEVKGEPSISVQAMEVSKFLDEQGLDHIDLMSMNIEGGEFTLLPHIISTGLIHRIDRMMLQWHNNAVNTSGRQRSIQESIACTHDMIWNLGAWEAWSRKEEE